jgi:GTP-binding protein
MKLAIVGKRNAGKSTFINVLCGQERCIVSEIPGTTRDSVDVNVELDGKRFVVIDTAGIKKAKKLEGDIEFYSQHRAMLSIRRADVIALMIDASVPPSQVDKDLAGKIALEMKPVVLVVSKWDLARDKATGEDYAGYLAKTFPELAFAPISLTSAREGLNVRQTVKLAEDIFQQASTRIPTAQLNETIAKITELRVPSHKIGSKAPKILYASQIGTLPPTIVLFVNDVKSFGGDYQRFLLNQFRDRLPFTEVPINLLIRQRRGEARKAWGEARKGQGQTAGGEPRRTPKREPVKVIRRESRQPAGDKPVRRGAGRGETGIVARRKRVGKDSGEKIKRRRGKH